MKKCIFISTIVFSIGTMSMAMPSIAGASTQPGVSSPAVSPPSAQTCAGDVCMFLSNPSGGFVTVQGWAYYQGFYGHFTLVAPGGTQNSISYSWPAGGSIRAGFSARAIVGNYSVTGWSGSINEGTVCNRVE
jgi:hypothetical protein